MYIYIYYIQYKSGSGGRVTVYGMSGTEGQDPGGTDPIDLQLPRGATGSSRMPTTEQLTPHSTAPVTRLIEEFVASDSISWRQGKFSWLEMVFLDCSESNQQTTL